MPSTNGTSGPTTINSMLFVRQKFPSRSNSSTPMEIFSAIVAVPALPGATNNFAHVGLCLIFQASACSRPPLPINRTFINELKTIKISGMLQNVDLIFRPMNCQNFNQLPETTKLNAFETSLSLKRI